MRADNRQRYPVYVPKVPRWWWLETAPYRRFVVRELTAPFVALYSVILLLFLLALSRGEEAYEGFLAWLDLPGVIVVHAIILTAVLYHTVTSIQLASQIQEVRLRRKVVSRRVVMTGLAGTWVVASGVLAYLQVRL